MFYSLTYHTEKTTGMAVYELASPYPFVITIRFQDKKHTSAHNVLFVKT